MELFRTLTSNKTYKELLNSVLHQLLNQHSERQVLDQEKKLLNGHTISLLSAKPHSSVGSIAYLRAGGHWFNPQLRQYSFQGLMIVITTGFIPLSTLSVVSKMVKWESSQWLGKNILLFS